MGREGRQLHPMGAVVLWGWQEECLARVRAVLCEVVSGGEAAPLSRDAPLYATEGTRSSLASVHTTQVFSPGGSTHSVPAPFTSQRERQFPSIKGL